MSAESRLGRFVERVHSMFKKKEVYLEAWQAEAILGGLIEGRDVVTGELRGPDGKFADTAIIVDGWLVTPHNKTIPEYLQELKDKHS